MLRGVQSSLVSVALRVCGSLLTRVQSGLELISCRLDGLCVHISLSWIVAFGLCTYDANIWGDRRYRYPELS